MEKQSTVLIIEDEDILSDIYAIKFNMDGYQTLKAKNGATGVGLAIHEQPDIILLDIIMPEKNGYEALRDLKTNKKTKDIPVVILSNLGQDYEIKTGMKLGAEKYLVKTAYTPAQVVGEVKDILEKKQKNKK